MHDLKRSKSDCLRLTCVASIAFIAVLLFTLLTVAVERWSILPTSSLFSTGTTRSTPATCIKFRMPSICTTRSAPLEGRLFLVGALAIAVVVAVVMEVELIVEVAASTATIPALFDRRYVGLSGGSISGKTVPGNVKLAKDGAVDVIGADASNICGGGGNGG